MGTRMWRAGLAGLAMAVAAFAFTPVQAAGGSDVELLKPEGGWSFEGPLGRYDEAALQRGFQVYQQICAGCHSMNLLSYRNLSQPGGPEFPVEVMEEIAAQAMVPAGPDEFGNTTDEFGLPLTRPGRPEDTFVAPYPNEQAARAANGGAYPPDMSVIAKARYGLHNYIYSLLQGYEEPPEGFEVMPGLYYNKFMYGNQIAMAQPLYDDMVVYEDGTPATIEQMSADVSHFLAWAAEPKLEQRKSLGLQVMIYLTIFAALLYLSYRRIWRDVEH